MDIKQYIMDKLSSSNIEYSLYPIQIEGKYHYLYLTTNQVNQRYYIGIHSCKKVKDPRYKGSGKALKEALSKYGYANLVNEPIAYFKTKLDLEHAEALVVTDELLQQESGKIYNLKSGGINDSTNLQHSQFMVEKMKDPVYKQYWKKQVQYYKEHPEEAKLKHRIETEEERKARYTILGEQSRERNLAIKAKDPEAYMKKMMTIHQKAVEAKRKIIIVENKQTGEKKEFNNRRETAKFLKTKESTISSLIKGGSQTTELGKNYKVYYKDPKHQQQVKQYQYADPYTRCTAVIAYDVFGNEVMKFNSVKEANQFVGAYDEYGLGAAIKKHYLSHGYYWKYANEELQKQVSDFNTRKLKNQHLILINPKTNQPEKYFNSFIEAVKEFKTDRQTIKKYVENGQEFRGYIWKYDGDHKSLDHRPKEVVEATRKPVGGSIERNGEIVIQYSSAQEASNQLNKCPSAISSAIRTGYKCANYYWRYLDKQ